MSTDIATALAPTPATPASLAAPSIVDAAADRLGALKADRGWGAKYLANDVAARNEFRTLNMLVHGGVDEATQRTLAASIGLQQTPSLVHAERQAEAAAATAADAKPQFNWQDRQQLGAEHLDVAAKEFGEWTGGLNLPPSIAKTITQAIVSSGVRSMDQAQFTAWREKQDAILLGAAGGDHDTVKAWRDAAAKLIAGSKFTFENSAALKSAQVIRSLALVASARKEK
jgi:hypothetical protein